MEQIKPTELRIGNYFQVNWSKEIRRADALDIRDIADNSIIGGVSPIPLTEEVLRAAGFEFKRGWKANGGEIDVDQYVLGQFDVAVASIGGIALTWRDRAINVQYLHQLQNLYFALTGSELEVSLPLIGNSPITDNK